MNPMFDQEFAWGAATASYQIEGAAAEAGRTPSVWDLFSEWPGKVANGQSGAVACDHYHRMPDDIALMKEIGLRAYRFSISWSRVLPEQQGVPNEAGIDFYDRLIDGLLEAGIEPWVTLFHWDFPAALYQCGGWLSPDSPKWFADYTHLMATRFSDRVTRWMTLNEPQVFIGLGHGTGEHAPGLKLSNRDLLEVQRHVLLAHGRSVQALRAGVKQPALIGIAPVSSVAIPHTHTPADIEAARTYGFESCDPELGLWPQQFCLDPIVLGQWPQASVEAFCPGYPEISAEDLSIISEKIDFIGLNYYQAVYVRQGDDGEPEKVPYATGHPRTGFDWPVLPEGLYWQIRFHHERYGLPCAITENGLSNLDWVSADGQVHDPQRISYIQEHTAWMAQAMKEGHPVLGYFHWSLLDNFEWAEGYRHRFGLIHVDYQTQKRTLKDSAHWYGKLIRSEVDLPAVTTSRHLM